MWVFLNLVLECTHLYQVSVTVYRPVYTRLYTSTMVEVDHGYSCTYGY